MTTLEQGTYLCRFDNKCKLRNLYRPDVVLPVQIRAADGQLKTLQKLNPCTHGGGCGCPHWRRQTNQDIGGHNKHLSKRDFQTERLY